MFEHLTTDNTYKIINEVNVKYPQLSSHDRKLIANYLFSYESKVIDGPRGYTFNSIFLIRFTVKVIANYFYFFLFLIRNRRNSENRHNVVKVWADINYDGWVEDLANKEHLIIVLPFLYNIKRGRDTILRFFRNKNKFCFYGYRYNLKLILKFLLSRKIEHYLEIEKDAINKFCHDLEKLKVSSLYTMDDVEPISYHQNTILMRSGIEVNFKSHGIGRYSIFYTANNAHFFNQSQCDFYQKNSSFNNVHLTYPLGRVTSKLTNIKNLVLVSSVTKNSSRSSIEYIKECELLSCLESIGNKYDYDIWVRYHPNVMDGYFDESNALREMDALNSNETILLSFGSTSYYDFEKFGLTVLVVCKEIDPRIIFGDKERHIMIGNLKHGCDFTDFLGRW